MIGPFTLYQFLVPAFALLMILRVISHYLRGEQSIREVIVWLTLWLGASAVALFPKNTVDLLAKITGVKSGVNAIIFFVLIILCYSTLKLYMLAETQEQKITELVRKLAIEKFNSEQKNKQEKTPELVG